MLTRSLRVLAAAAVAVAAAPAAKAADPTQPILAVAESVLRLGPASFQIRDCDWAAGHLQYGPDAEPGTSFRVHEGFAKVSLAAPVNLPPGAQVARITVYYYDTDPDSEPEFALWSIGTTGEATLVKNVPAWPGFAKGNAAVRAYVLPLMVAAGPYEVLVTLNRSQADYALQQALFRVDVAYRMGPVYTSR